MKRLLTSTLGLALVALLTPALAKEGDFKTSKAALQALNDYIGTWNGSGAPDKFNVAAKDTWKESVELGWKFKGSDAWLVLNFNGDKRFKTGELRYLLKKKTYELTITDKQDKKLVFEGGPKGDYLTFERVDSASKETQQMKMNLTNEGARLTYRYGFKPEGKTLFTKDYVVGCTREGVSLGAKEKKNECIVSGGLGTSTVSYKGQTYYVCCSGCREAFQEDPEKYVKEFEAKKKKAGK